VSADSLTHVLSDRETLETVAQHYYGDASWAEALRRHNALGETEAAPGTALFVPLPSIHRVEEGDSWQSLAARYWGEAGLGECLSELSQVPAGELTPGQEIRIPVLLPHALRQGESLAALSRRLTGGPDSAAALAALNHIEEPRRLAVGQVVLVPILGPPRVGAAGPGVQPPAEEQPVAVQESVVLELPTGFADELRHATAAYRAGDFEDARELLEGLRPAVLAEGSSQEQHQLLQQLTRLYAAFDETEPLCTSYRALRALDPSFEWDPELTSPKIIRLAASCEETE